MQYSIMFYIFLDYNITRVTDASFAFSSLLSHPSDHANWCQSSFSNNYH